MVMGMSQRTALNKTALKTAGWLGRWGKTIKAEMVKQGISRHPLRQEINRPGTSRFRGFPKYTDDNDELITFTRGQIRRLLDEMARQKAELERFEKKPQPETTTDSL